MVRRVFHLVYREITGLHQAAYVLGLFAFGSQLLAIVRDRLLASAFGAGVELDIYYAAFRVPDLLFVLFASMLSVYVLLPFVSATAESAAKRHLLSQVFTLFLVGYALLAGGLLLTASWYVPLLFPGYVTHVDELVLLVQLLLLQPLFLGISSICGTVTQMSQRFVLYALSPLLYNLGIIAGISALYPLFGLPGLAYGVVLGAILHLLVQVPFVRGSQLRFWFTSRIDWRFVGELIKTAIPRALTLSLNQLVLLLFVGLATTFAVGSVSVFQLAYNIQSVPLAIIGMSYSVAAFPTLSHLFAQQERERFNEQIVTAMRHIIFWSVPIIGLVIVLRAHIVRVLLGSGEFDWSDTRLTAAVLAVFVVSLVAQAVLLLLVRALYAGGRTRLPLYMTLCSSAAAVGLAFTGLELWRSSMTLQVWVAEVLRVESLVGVEIVILAGAFAVGQLLQLGLLLGVATRVFGTPIRQVGKLLGTAAVSAVAGSTAAYLTLQFIVAGINQDTFIGITLQGVTAGIAGVLAVWVTYALLGTPELHEIASSFRLKLFKTDVLAKQDRE